MNRIYFWPMLLLASLSMFSCRDGNPPGLPTESQLQLQNSLLLAGSPGNRWVTANERGSYFTYPWDGRNGDWTGLGAYVGTPHSSNFDKLAPNAIKVRHGRFHVLGPDDGAGQYLNIGNDFPYAELRAFEAAEVAAGRDPIFITATYQGQKRQVVWEWSLTDPGTTYPQEAVNVGDPRFVKFWVDEYVRKIVWPEEAQLDPNTEWVGVDQCAFSGNLYGVIDNDGEFVPNVQWDEPFPQTPAEYFASINAFFVELKNYAPDINVMTNIGSMSDWSYFEQVFKDIPGVIQENFPDPYTPKAKKYFDVLTWFGSQGGVAILRASKLTDTEDSYRSAYAAYLIVRGDNFFFNPRLAGSSYEIPPDKFEKIKNDLGLPIAEMQELQSGVYSRTTEHGIVFYNLNKDTKSVSLPAGHSYLNRNGEEVTSMTLPARTGDYVTAQ